MIRLILASSLCLAVIGCYRDAPVCEAGDVERCFDSPDGGRLGASFMGGVRPGGIPGGAVRKVTIMVLGDSLSSWWVYGRQSTAFEQRADIISVGSVSPLPVGQPQKEAYDRFEGHGGTPSSTFLSSIVAWYTPNPAAIVSMHIGTAEYFLGQTDANVHATNMKGIVDAILAINPAAKFYVAKILNARSDQTAFNGYVVAFRAAVTTILSSYPSVTMVDMPTIPDAQYEDTIHPTGGVGQPGYVAMANAWYAALLAGGAI